ncbi:hypothetical protein CN376_23020 [Bacillus cereus]|uniref:GH25 family lysozyme n=1 Tax=Bacillus cereus TaxID=1396 RepID=UPI000BF56646|nr:GH25 family lysozyme [Bacillus cereus]PEZ87954.1 hypothetical protein CN376_23020 [Bacillus cereus]PFR12606.1 hypothetical protein COK30_13745 [Bacillus cereus]
MFQPNQPGEFVVDISHHNNDIDFDVARQHVGYFIARTGDGHRVNTNGERQGILDRKYKQFTSQMKAKGIPFGNYMFNRFSGVASARQEAEDFWAVGDKAATSWVCDAEVSTAPNMLECIQAFVDRLRELGAKKVGLYIGHHKYKEFGGSQVKNIDFVWIPRYGAKPSFDCDIWQFTETGQVPGIGKCDINMSMNPNKPINWYYQGETQPQQPKMFKVQTGGVAYSQLPELSQMLAAAGVTGQVHVQLDGTAYATTDGFEAGTMDKFTTQLDSKNWWYTYL